MRTGYPDGRGVVMMVMSFRPKAMGGAELQCERLSRELQDQGVRVMIVTEGAQGLARYELMDGLEVHRIHSWANSVSRAVLNVTRRFRRPTPRPLPRGQLPYDPRDHGIRTTNTYAELLAYALFFVNCLPFLWKRRNTFQVIHVHVVPWISFVGAALGAILRRPVLVKESTTTGLEKFDSYPCGSAMRKFVTRHCYFIGMSAAIREKLAGAGVPGKRVFAIPNGVHIPQDRARSSRIPWTCLFVGNLSQGAAKGLDVLLHAWKAVVEECPRATLTILGGGDWGSFKEYVDMQGIRAAVAYEGHVADPSAYYRRTEVFVLPSRREGMSNALLEAMAHGMPLVATRISGNEDLVRDHLHGLLVPPDDPVALAEAILYLFAHRQKARTMGKAGKERVTRLCKFEEVARQHIRAYDIMTRQS
jgi:glycosyltransferase involved in cell wall biosynthesis